MRKPRGYWDVYENVYNEALKYTSSKEFDVNNHTAYIRACYHGWIKKFIWFKHPEHWNKKWDYETCKEESKKYSNIYDFQHGSGSAYCVASKNKWLKEYEWIIYKQRPKGYYTYKVCKEISKNYANRTDFHKGCYQAWWVSLKNGWIDDFTWLKPKDEVWNKFTVYCYKFKTAIYIGLTMRAPEERDYEHRNCIKSSVFKHSLITGEEIPKMIIVQDELIKTDAQKIETELIEKYKNASNIKLLNKVRGGGVGTYGKGSYTKSKCLKIAKSCNCRMEFKRKSYQAWWVSLKNGWIDDYVWFKKPIHIQWDYNACKKEAQKYRTRSEFNNGNTSAYQSSWKNGWLDDFFPKNK